VLIEPQVFGDARGFFMETWQQEKFKAAGIDARTCRTITAAPLSGRCGGCICRCSTRRASWCASRRAAYSIVWSIYGVAAPSYGTSVGVELSAENHRMLWFRRACGARHLDHLGIRRFSLQVHGFLLSEHERTLAWDDAA